MLSQQYNVKASSKTPTIEKIKGKVNFKLVNVGLYVNKPSRKSKLGSVRLPEGV